jgi:hypothetical protein
VAQDLRRIRFESDFFIEVGPGRAVVTNRRSMEPAFFEELAARLRELGVALEALVHDPGRDDWP